MIKPNKPIHNSYPVDERVYASEYPGDLHNPVEKVKSFVDFGITHFIDLTEEGELNPYRQYLPEGIAHCRFPIQDVSVPRDVVAVFNLMQYIESVLSNPSNKIYIHCWGGVGRTGVIIVATMFIMAKNLFKHFVIYERVSNNVLSPREDILRKHGGKKNLFKILNNT